MDDSTATDTQFRDKLYDVKLIFPEWQVYLSSSRGALSFIVSYNGSSLSTRNDISTFWLLTQGTQG
jgi:hypothetical protein